MNNVAWTILVVDDDADVRRSVSALLEARFRTIEAGSGLEALRIVEHTRPDLILLDIMMPEMDGYSVCQRFREKPMYRNVPIIYLSAKGEIADRVKAVQLGADDYIKKPFDAGELEYRIEMCLRRAHRNLNANPLTGLPGNVIIQEQLDSCLSNGLRFAVLYIDIDNFKAFNDIYGFERGDDVIRSTAKILGDVVAEIGVPTDFVGHIGGDDFVITTDPERADRFAAEIIHRFDASIPEFYDEEVRRRGHVVTRDRRGHLQQYPLMTISIAGVHNEQRPIRHRGEISRIGSELKLYAKAHPNSFYIRDRRQRERRAQPTH
jgi:diguanylate cyclase (GGDEF)-like protein